MSDTEWTTFRVRKSDKEIAAKAKGDDETWSEYVLRCAEQPRVELSEAEIREIVRDEIGEKVIDEARR
jgi:hypothetical protein